MQYESLNDIVERLQDIPEENRLVQFKKWNKGEEIEPNPLLLTLEFSEYRSNIVSWMPLKENCNILEINAGCGCITEYFTQKDCMVTCYESDARKGRVNDWWHVRNKQYKRVEDLWSLEQKYDYIMILDRVEEFEELEMVLSKFQKLLTNEGKIVIAFQNPYGIQSLAGLPDSVTGRKYDAIMGYAESETLYSYSKKKMVSLLERLGYRVRGCYYPYPNHLFASTIYSDKRLPTKGELAPFFMTDKFKDLATFDLQKAIDSVVENDMFPELCNSYLLIVDKESL